MRNDLVEEVLQFHSLEDIILTLELSEFEVLQAMLDMGVVTSDDLAVVLGYDEEDDEND